MRSMRTPGRATRGRAERTPVPAGFTVADDARLMQGIRGGEAAALEALYDRYARLVFAVCVRMLRDSGEAEEVLQDVFWEVWRKAERYDPTRAAPRAYLLNLTRSRALDRLRRDLRRDDLALRAGLELGWLVPESPGTDRGAIAGEERRAIRRALTTLPAAQRRAVMLSFFDGLTHSQIAAALDEPLGTIKTRIRKGLLRLHDALIVSYDEGRKP